MKTLLQPAGANGSARWDSFRHAMPVDSDEAEGVPISNLLYLAPRVAQPLIGPVVEQVTLTRDEQANIAWAIEQILESPLQVGIALSDARPPEPRGDPQAPPQYKLFHRPPPHWVPLLPVRTGPDAQVLLARGSVGDEAGNGRLVGSVTTMLAGGTDGALLIPEEEVPRRWARGAASLSGGALDRRHPPHMGGLSRPARRLLAVREFTVQLDFRMRHRVGPPYRALGRATSGRVTCAT